MSPLLESYKESQLRTFRAYWETCPRQAYIREHATGWDGLESAFLGDAHAINALRAAGAIVHVHGITSEGDWAFEVTNWRPFNRDVFAIMGIDDPRDSLSMYREDA